MSKKKKSDIASFKDLYDDLEHLGLDADGSSTGSDYSNLNSDNDRVSGNPDGEDDQKNTNEPPGHSLLEDK